MHKNNISFIFVGMTSSVMTYTVTKQTTCKYNHDFKKISVPHNFSTSDFIISSCPAIVVHRKIKHGIAASI